MKDTGFSRGTLCPATIILNAARIVAIGSSKANLQALAMDIFNLCLVNSIVLEAQWIPRSLNERADLLSRFVDKDD